MATKTYFFQPGKASVKQGYLMTDEDKNVVYEANMLKFSLFGGYTYEFINHAANTTAVHKVGNTITQESSGLLGGLSTKSHFKFDGKKIWDFLHEQGIRIDSRLSGGSLGMTYTVTLKGRELASVSTAPAGGGKGLITSGTHYNVTAAEEDLDLAFLCAFAFARTDQTFYR